MNASSEQVTSKAVVLLSGGLDSATALAMVHQQGYACYTLAVDYGQRHNAELAAAARISGQFAEAHKVVSVDLRAIGGSALTDDIAVPESGKDLTEQTIPVTYVPARNTVLLALALGYAETLAATHIVIGVNAVDYSGYPDCRPGFISAFQEMAAQATKMAIEGAQPLLIETPLIALSKAEIIKAGTAAGLDYAMTVSCYQADSKGRACGICDSCRLRRAGFIEAGIPDPTRYR